MRSARQQIKSQATAPITTWHHGVIHTASPLTIYLDGGTVALGAHLLGGYTPAVNDVVLVMNESGSLTVVQKWAS
jgi:hypothetical protein